MKNSTLHRHCPFRLCRGMGCCAFTRRCRSRAKFSTAPKIVTEIAVIEPVVAVSPVVVKQRKVRTDYSRTKIARQFPRAPGMDEAREALMEVWRVGGDPAEALTRIRALLSGESADKRLKEYRMAA